MRYPGSYLQFKLSTATVSVVQADLRETDLKELGQIDQESRQEGREEITEDSAGAGVDPSVVVRPTNSQISLNTNCEDEEDTQTHDDPEHQLYKHITEKKVLSLFSK